ncbi:MAG: NADH:ubiquinone reductase (Na(+)-transporting) subunit B [Planctomycetes bacterium]|nr:NADH:ubiquinone reductase (Na(+)-transporting) subunit B [Planctomycetota bacterium]
MKFLRKQLDKLEPLFERGGKLERLFPVFEAMDSFMFTSGKTAQSGAHIRDGIDMKRLMMIVVYALLPATLFAMYNAGYQEMLAAGTAAEDIGLMAAFLGGAWKFLPLYIVTLAAGGIIEATFSIIRKHEINEGFLVTSLLYPLIVPPDLPLWQAAMGIAFGVLIGKEIFGGTGMNVLNPALTGRIFLFFAYPGQISGDSVWIAGKENWIDGWSGATPLAQFYGGTTHDTVLMPDGQTVMTWWDAFVGMIPGSLGETSALACFIGAFILIITKVGSWRIMAGCMIGMFAMAGLFNLIAVNSFMQVPWYWHLVTGGFAFGMVFMATDPVSAASTDTGRWIYGILIGVLTVLVRVVNPAYPEGMMLAIIFMNVFAPTIDYYVVKSNIKRREKRLGLQ